MRSSTFGSIMIHWTLFQFRWFESVIVYLTCICYLKLNLRFFIHVSQGFNSESVFPLLHLQHFINIFTQFSWFNYRTTVFLNWTNGKRTQKKNRIQKCFCTVHFVKQTDSVICIVMCSPEYVCSMYVLMCARNSQLLAFKER